MGWKSIIIESDASKAVEAIHKLHPFSMEAHVVSSIQSLCSKLEYISIVHSPRSSNQLAHELVTRSFKSRSDFVFKQAIPWDLKCFVFQDLRFN